MDGKPIKAKNSPYTGNESLERVLGAEHKAPLLLSGSSSHGKGWEYM